MNYASFDLETTGLSPCRHNILEAAFVIDGEDYYDKPLRSLPWNSMLIVQEDYYCSPYVAMMHTKNGLWDDIEQAKKRIKDNIPFDLEKGHKPARENVVEGLRVLFAQMGSILGNRVTLAGKNVSSFDMRFLLENGVVNQGWSLDEDFCGWVNPCKGMKIVHRTLDVGPMYFRKGLDGIPDTKMCCELAGIPTPNMSHRAYGDCIQVAALIRKKINGKLSDEDLGFLEVLSN